MRGWKLKYYKGLGTSTAAEAREYFTNMNKVQFEWDTPSDHTLDLAFNKKRADDRKEWLTTYDEVVKMDVVLPEGVRFFGHVRMDSRKFKLYKKINGLYFYSLREK